MAAQNSAVGVGQGLETPYGYLSHRTGLWLLTGEQVCAAGGAVPVCGVHGGGEERVPAALQAHVYVHGVRGEDHGGLRAVPGVPRARGGLLRDVHLATHPWVPF